MAAHAKLSESELNARYIAALARFSNSADWRAYLALAEEFRALDTYRDSAQLYDRCIKAASAPVAVELPDGSYENLIDGAKITVQNGTLFCTGAPVILCTEEAGS